MKDYVAGRIFCKCSARMHCRGRHVQIYERTPKRKECPNCGQLCKVMVRSKKNDSK